MYISKPSDNAICQTMSFSYQWKYVQLSRLTINANCQALSFSYQWMYVHLTRLTINANCQTLSSSYPWKYVLSKPSDDYNQLQYSEINSVLCQLTQSRGHVKIVSQDTNNRLWHDTIRYAVTGVLKSLRRKPKEQGSQPALTVSAGSMVKGSNNTCHCRDRELQGRQNFGLCLRTRFEIIMLSLLCASHSKKKMIGPSIINVTVTKQAVAPTVFCALLRNSCHGDLIHTSPVFCS